MNKPSTEFFFDDREWYRLLLFLCSVFCVGGFLAGVVSGHPWPYIFRCTIALPLIGTPLFWLVGCRSTRRSYVFTAESIVLRRRGRDLERITWAEVACIRIWPLALILRSGRKVTFYLLRAEMLRARDFLLHTHPQIPTA